VFWSGAYDRSQRRDYRDCDLPQPEMVPLVATTYGTRVRVVVTWPIEISSP